MSREMRAGAVIRHDAPSLANKVVCLHPWAVCNVMKALNQHSCSLNTRLAKAGQDSRAGHEKDHHFVRVFRSFPVTGLGTDPSSVHPQNVSSCHTGVARESVQWSCSVPLLKRTDLIVAAWPKFCLLLRVLNVSSTGTAGVKCCR